MTKAVAINASPNMDKGNTSVILNPFLDGLREGGADVELFHTRKLRINPCLGEFHCWVKEPGRCFQRDDMDALLPKIGEADILVLAMPLYVDGMPGPLKTLLDRTLPLARPTIDIRDGRCRHPGRQGAKGPRFVLIASCGFWAKANFDPLVEHVKAISENFNGKFAGALLRPHGPALRAMMERGLPVQDVVDAAREAGRQLTTEDAISADLENTVSRDLLPLEMYVSMANQYFSEDAGSA